MFVKKHFYLIVDWINPLGKNRVSDKTCPFAGSSGGGGGSSNDCKGSSKDKTVAVSSGEFQSTCFVFRLALASKKKICKHLQTLQKKGTWVQSSHFSPPHITFEVDHCKAVIVVITIENKMQVTTQKSIKNCIRNRCQNRHCILFASTLSRKLTVYRVMRKSD